MLRGKDARAGGGKIRGMVSYTIDVDIEESSAARVVALKRLAKQAGASSEREAWLEGGRKKLIVDFATSEAAATFSELRGRLQGP